MSGGDCLEKSSEFTVQSLGLGVHNVTLDPIWVRLKDEG